MKKISEQEYRYLHENTLSFAEHTAQAFQDMTGMECQINTESFGIMSQNFPDMIHAVMPFYGTIQGEYILSLEEKTAALLIGVSEEGFSSDDQKELRQEYGEFIVEVLNASAGQTIQDLKKSFEEPTMLPGHIIFGQMHYPNIQCGFIEIKAEPGSIFCRFFLNLMNLKIAEELEYTRELINLKNKEIRQSRKNLEQVMEVLPGLNKTVDEFFFAQNQIYQNPAIQAGADSDINKYFDQLNTVSTKLRSTLMLLWSVPLQQAFQKVGNILDQVSAKFGKQVQIYFSGGETEINRQMEDVIVKALHYILKNILEHGIERPEERKKLGKPKKTGLQIRGYSKGRNIFIEFEDDGRGLNRKRIIDMAVRQQMISPKHQLTDEETEQLVFSEKLFSKVGKERSLYKVKKVIDRLNGNVSVRSFPGKGTKFTIRIPLTMSVTEGMVVGIDAQQYIIPISFIKESLSLNKEDCFTVEGRGEMIRLRGKLMPAIHLLNDLFNVKSSMKKTWEYMGIVVEYENEYACILVDEIMGKHEAVVQSLSEGEWLKVSECVAGGTIMASGRVNLVLDIRSVFHLLDTSESFHFSQN